VVRTSARRLAGSDGATFVLRDGDKCYYAEEDAISPLWKGQRFPMSACISGWSMLNKKTVIIPDIYLDNRIPILAYKPTFVKSLTMVPIRTIDPIGAIGNYWATSYTPTREQLMLLQSLADITSVSIENIYAYHKLEEKNKKLMEIASMQSHQVRSPVASIQGLVRLFNKQDPADKVNAEIMDKVSTIADSFDGIIREIVKSASLVGEDQ
jgi:GAF domain-containing protein